MLVSRWLICASGAFLLGCAHAPPVPPPPVPQEQPKSSIRLDEGWDSRRTNQRLMIQINNEPPFIQDSESGGQQMMYHGLPLTPDRIKSINVLNATQARKRFGDPKLDGAIFIEMK